MPYQGGAYRQSIKDFYELVKNIKMIEVVVDEELFELKDYL